MLFRTLKLASTYKSVVTPNKNGKFFFTVMGNTYPIKDKLKSLGFKFFQGVWSTGVDYLDENKKNELQALGVDLSPLSSIAPAPTENPFDLQNVNNTENQIAAPATSVDSQILDMQNELKSTVEGAGGKAKDLLTKIDEIIDRVAKMTDEAAQSEFVKNFLRFSARFHNYSFGNQMLIWFQKPDATHVAGHKKWMELGRQISNWNNPISITAPFRKNLTEEEKARRNTTQDQIMFFGTVKVYDISDTAPIPGTKDVFNPEWRKDSNEESEETKALIDAGITWANSIGIGVNFEEMSKSQGGYSKGTGIGLNKEFKGINLFSTLVHELAHETLHWIGNQKPENASESRQDKEIDAETTAYIVLDYYGFETKDTPNYLALWKASGENVKKRRDNINKAVKAIISGINENIASSENIEKESKYKYQQIVKFASIKEDGTLKK